VDQFTKMLYSLPYIKSCISVQETVNLIMHKVFHHHGLLDNIISDRNLQFISHVYKHLCDGLQILTNSFQHIILKLIVKQSVQIKYLSSMFDASLVINKII
jgi:hypothetical protein